ncbi:MAG TPA: hypothetical protein VIY51_20750 [Xanthobacteraceae bacterium]
MSYDYESLKALALELNRPMETLVALSIANDPFYAGQPGRKAKAEWFAALWHRFRFRAGVHIRRIHYVLISQNEPVTTASGMPYENSVNCWVDLCKASKDARCLGLVSIDDFEDQRIGGPTLRLAEPKDGEVEIEDDEIFLDRLAPPKLSFTPPTIPQRYHVEVWCEKSTIDDILLPLASQYSLNIVTGTGEISLTFCRDLVRRVEESGRPCRILYISDFDPAGLSMPVAVARKIEFLLYDRGLDLDIQVRPIALTHDQCVRFRLPRTPIKETEKRAPDFESRYGEGATELDALEAIRPGELRRILEVDIQRYFDSGLDDMVSEAAQEFEESIDEINEAVHEHHAQDIAELQAEFDGLTKRARKLWRTVKRDLEKHAPDLDAVEWPEPGAGYEDENPLFDSGRDYVEQIDRYKKHQEKPIARRGYGTSPRSQRRRAVTPSA